MVFGARFELRINAALDRTRLPGCATRTCKHILSKIWRKAGDSNAYVPKDSGLAGQWDTNYPSLPITYRSY